MFTCSWGNSAIITCNQTISDLSKAILKIPIRTSIRTSNPVFKTFDSFYSSYLSVLELKYRSHNFQTKAFSANYNDLPAKCPNHWSWNFSHVKMQRSIWDKGFIKAFPILISWLPSGEQVVLEALETIFSLDWVSESGQCWVAVLRKGDEGTSSRSCTLRPWKRKLQTLTEKTTRRKSSWTLINLGLCPEARKVIFSSRRSQKQRNTSVHSHWVCDSGHNRNPILTLNVSWWLLL